MTTLVHRRATQEDLRQLVRGAPKEPAALGDEHRLALRARFRAVASPSHRRLDAWMVERAGQSADGFRWSPASARRVLGNAALRRVGAPRTTPLIEAVRDELLDHLLRAAAGHARTGSLADWLAHSPAPVHALVTAEALSWAAQVVEIGEGLEEPWSVALSDAYYDVAGARTTLRARRDLVTIRGEESVLVRLRSGSPGKSAGAGLRADLTIATLADPRGVAPARLIGLWPDAGVCLAVDGTMDDLRAGARDLVRTAVVQQRRQNRLAA